MHVANPFLQFTEFRTSGRCGYSHGGDTPRLGVGVGRFGYTSPVEVNFSEVLEGRRARGASALSVFYRVRQVVVEEKQWHWQTGSVGRWSIHATRTNLPDDPMQESVAFNVPSSVVSFYDAPGISASYLSTHASVQRICCIQNFRLWVEVASIQVRGNFQAASDFFWHHLICMEQIQGNWRVNTQNSLLGRGELRLTQPLWR